MSESTRQQAVAATAQAIGEAITNAAALAAVGAGVFAGTAEGKMFRSAMQTLLSLNDRSTIKALKKAGEQNDLAG
ncbi:hypothetical protein [Inquilinus sp. OTU3971]|uniref:hypothetical protein n=1 Tax=Inquilinus sp. OTU3971 TaxID=3043855 RepID=UPI00313CA235